MSIRLHQDLCKSCSLVYVQGRGGGRKGEEGGGGREGEEGGRGDEREKEL